MTISYLSAVQQQKRIVSYFLLASYLLVLLHHSISHNHSSEFDKYKTSKNTHKHEDIKSVHHKHDFYTGVFHFLGHLFERVNHPNGFEDKYLIGSEKNNSTKAFKYERPVYFYADLDNLVISKVDPESLSDPPYILPFIQKFIQSDTPLRGPPAMV